MNINWKGESAGNAWKHHVILRPVLYLFKKKSIQYNQFKYIQKEKAFELPISHTKACIHEGHNKQFKHAFGFIHFLSDC